MPVKIEEAPAISPPPPLFVLPSAISRSVAGSVAGSVCSVLEGDAVAAGEGVVDTGDWVSEVGEPVLDTDWVVGASVSPSSACGRVRQQRARAAPMAVLSRRDPLS